MYFTLTLPCVYSYCCFISQPKPHMVKEIRETLLRHLTDVLGNDGLAAHFVLLHLLSKVNTLLHNHNIIFLHDNDFYISLFRFCFLISILICLSWEVPCFLSNTWPWLCIKTYFLTGAVESWYTCCGEAFTKSHWFKQRNCVCIWNSA